MAESRQESCTSDGAVKITQKKWYQVGIEKVSLKGHLGMNKVCETAHTIMFFHTFLNLKFQKHLSKLQKKISI